MCQHVSSNFGSFLGYINIYKPSFFLENQFMTWHDHLKRAAALKPSLSSPGRGHMWRILCWKRRFLRNLRKIRRLAEGNFPVKWWILDSPKNLEGSHRGSNLPMVTVHDGLSHWILGIETRQVGLRHGDGDALAAVLPLRTRPPFHLALAQIWGMDP
jgi:hypothetical protein